jgi:hypothetical protein
MTSPYASSTMWTQQNADFTNKNFWFHDNYATQMRISTLIRWIFYQQT